MQSASSAPSTLRKVFWSAGFGWMFDAMDVGLLSFIMVSLSKEWGLTSTAAGMLGTVNLIGMAVGAMLGGYLADRVGRRPVFFMTLIVFGAASLSSAAATGLLIMLLFRFLMGIGLGAELPVASTLVNEFAPKEKRGRTVVLLESFWAVGWIAAAALSYFVIPEYGWQVAVILSAFPLVYAILIRRNIPESPQYHKPAKPASLRVLWSRHGRETAALWAVWFAIAFSYYGMFLWLPSVMVAKGFSVIKSFEYVLIMTLAQLPGYFTAAYLVEKWGRKLTLALFLALTAAAALMFGWSQTLTWLLVTGALLSFSNLGAWGALYAYTPENYPDLVRATGAGMASAVGRLGSIAAPLLVGSLVAAQYSYAWIFGIFTVILLAGVAALLILGKETKGELS